MQPKYEVPVIPHNLRREETIVQIAEALNYLADVAADIFARIENRIARNTTQVHAVAERIAAAGTQLDKLAGVKKATQVFSSSKYPAEHVNRPYTSIFHDGTNKLPLKKFAHDYKSHTGGEEQLEALQFYYVKLKQKAERHQLSGLGEIPTEIEAINDVLLFNTGRNPYDKEAAAKLAGSSQVCHARKGDREAVDGDVDISAAPFSMQGQSVGMQTQRVMGENYFYSPHLGTVPTIDVPLDLPDLPGIADDLRYHIEKEPVIAPSISSTFLSAIPDLPEVEDVVPVVPEVQVVVEEKPETKVIIEEAPVKESPQPIPVEVEQPKPIIGVKEEKKREAVIKPAPVDNSRASLMEAIRQAGGTKNLKHKTEARKTESPAPTGDLMADLHAKLSMRRKGISGNKPENPSAMDKISAMIPPPPQADLSESAEEEWDE